MDRNAVVNMLSLIPARTARRQSGSFFDAREGRAASLSRFLNWMSPLNPTTKEDQAAIGYTTAAPRSEDGDAEESSDEEALAPEPGADPERLRMF